MPPRKNSDALSGISVASGDPGSSRPPSAAGSALGTGDADFQPAFRNPRQGNHPRRGNYPNSGHRIPRGTSVNRNQPNANHRSQSHSNRGGNRYGALFQGKQPRQQPPQNQVQRGINFNSGSGNFPRGPNANNNSNNNTGLANFQSNSNIPSGSFQKFGSPGVNEQAGTSSSSADNQNFTATKSNNKASKDVQSQSEQTLDPKSNNPDHKSDKFPPKFHNGVNGTVLKLYETYGFILVDQKEPVDVKDLASDGRFYFKLSAFKSSLTSLVLSEKAHVVFTIRLNSSDYQIENQPYEIINVALKHFRTEDEIYNISGAFTNSENLPDDSKLKQFSDESQKPSHIVCDAIVMTLNPQKNFCHVKPKIQMPPQIFRNDNLILHYSNLLYLGIDLCRGDVLQVSIDLKNAERIEHASLKELAFEKSRPPTSIYAMANNMNLFLNSENDKFLVEQFSNSLPVKAVLKAFSSKSDKLSTIASKNVVLEASMRIMNFCLDHFSDHYNKDLIKVLATDGFFDKNHALHSFIVSKKTETGLENLIRDNSSNENQNLSLQNMSSFLIEAVRICPEIGRKIHKLLTANPEAFSTKFYLDLIEVITKPFAVKVEDMTYKEVKLVPTTEELSQIMVDERSFLNINPVVTKGAYDSVESYVETYFNLLRYDCFFNLLVGIKNYLKGDLDFRDMNVATDGVFFALSFVQRSMSNVFVVTAKLLRRQSSNNNNLLDSRAFMFGNLVAISSTGLFNDIIWATVYHRDDKLDNNGYVTVFLEYASEVNEKSFIDALELLIRSSGSCVIAESPTYYHSYKPVLRSIQNLNSDSLPFRVELVTGQQPFNVESPHASSTFRRGILFKCECAERGGFSYANISADCPHNRPLMVEDYLDKVDDDVSIDKNRFSGSNKDGYVVVDAGYTPPSRRSSLSDDSDSDDESRSLARRFGSSLRLNSDDVETSVLDPSQTVAIKNLLRNRIAIVQGPPGTGKTYLGVNFTNVLLDLKDEEGEQAITGPIMILTYKNHALDEFSKHILQNRQVFRNSYGSFIRVGGRSKDAEVQKFSLHNFLGRKGKFDHVLFEKRNKLAEELKEAIKLFCAKCMRLDYSVALKHFDNVQIENLLKRYAEIESNKLFGKELDKMVKMFDSLSNIGQILFCLLSNRFYQPGIENLEKLFSEAFEAWLPPDDVTIQIQHQESNKKYEAIKKAKLYERINQSDLRQGDDPDELLNDPVAIQKLIEERYEAAGMNHDQVKDLPMTKIAWGEDSSDNPYGSSKYPKCLQSLGNVSKIIAAKTDLENLKYISNPWDLSETERLHFLQAMLVKQSELAAAKLKVLFDEYENVSDQIKKVENSREAEALKQARVIAMTITGAAIRNDVLNAVKPSVIIVEEAAEINEAQLIALLGDHVKHLILIGDHQQLRPQVECYTLVKKYNFDVSMMERLINNNLPFATLAAQNRMRPDISKYLRDIYPDLLDNERVFNNKPVNCLVKNCFFWNHNFPERSGRSHSNGQEAKTVIDFVKFLANFNGYPLKSITVLSGYQGQTAELRKLSRADPGLKPPPGDRNYENRLDIQTIDMFQGDENEIVIVSLVRNNPQRNPGFLGILNRRCVAQSRSKSGVYFLGNAATLSGREKSEASRVWKPFLEKLSEDGCVGDSMVIKCQNHEDVTYSMTVGKLFPTQPFCNKVCDFLMPCKMHNCKLQCQPYHSKKHEICYETVDFMHKCGKHLGWKKCHEDKNLFRCPEPCIYLYHEKDEEKGPHLCKEKCGNLHSHAYCLQPIEFLCPDNGHRLTRKCYQAESDIKCEVIVSFTYSHCNYHSDKKRCYEKVSSKTCRHDCLKKMDPCGHSCKERCQISHVHNSILGRCKEVIPFTCAKCGNGLERLCYQSESDIICQKEVEFIYPNCKRHKGIRKCYERTEDQKCPNQCGLKLVECNHLCKRPCESEHKHDAKSAECDENVDFKHHCGQALLRQCMQKETDITCTGPCRRVLNCGHNCYLSCEPAHRHKTNTALICRVKVTEPCTKCQNPLTRQCHQKLDDIKCEAKLRMRFLKCGHIYERKCHEKEEQYQCQTTCNATLEKCGHSCFKKCGEPHKHDSSDCPTKVDFVHTCGNKLTRKCYETDNSVPCLGPCPEKLPCKHHCVKTCKPEHRHDYPCEKMVAFDCDVCGTTIPKKCFQEQCLMSCTGKTQRHCDKCGSDSEGPCTKNLKTFQCRLPCVKKHQECGHTCSQKCHEDCLHAKCKPCIEEQKEKERQEQKLRDERQKMEIKQKRDQLKQYYKGLRDPKSASVYKYDLDPANAETSQEYFSFKNQVMKYLVIKPGFMTKIKKVTKVHNFMAHKRLVEHQMKLIDPRKEQQMLFFTTESSANVEKYLQTGFHSKFTRQQRGRKGPKPLQGKVTFCSLSPEVTFKGENFIFSVLICDVLIGKCKGITQGQNEPRHVNDLHGQFDSAFISSGEGYSQYFIYNPFHIVVTGCVTFTLEPQANMLSFSQNEPWRTGSFQKIRLEPSREIVFDDWKDKYFRMAESQFLRLAQKNNLNATISHVDLYFNPELEEKFKAKQQKLESKLSKEILVFHGTPMPDPDPIMKENFRLDKIRRTAHGFGIYFSEFPKVSIGYAGKQGGSLIVARVLPGRQHEASDCRVMMPNSRIVCREHDSHLVGPGEENYSHMVIIQDVDQILPMFNIHWK